MPKFKFRLQKILDYRKQLEDQAANALAQAKALLLETKKRLVAIENEASEQRILLSAPQNLSPGELWLRKSYVEGLHLEALEVKKRLVLCQQQVDICQETLAERAKEHALLKKLKEKQAKQHAKEELLSEQRIYDETATIRHNNAAF